MANTTLTHDWIVLKCLQVLHAKLNFIGSITRDYDSQFAVEGAKIGESLRIRLPEKFVVNDGPDLIVQPSTEQSTTIAFAKHKHVGMNFTLRDMTLSVDDFTERKIIPAMSVLASTMEADALTMVLDVYNMVGTPGVTPASIAVFGQARAKLNQYLAPLDKRRTALIDSLTSAAMAEALKLLFHDEAEIKRQYKEGIMGHTQGFTFAENDLLPVLTTGTRLSTDTCVLSANAVEGDTSIAVSGLTGAATIKKGEIITIAGCFAVHPETKQAYSHLQQFVVTADATMAGGAGTILISPALLAATAYQNIDGLPVATNVVNFSVAGGGSGLASTAYGQAVTYHKQAFAFVTADFAIPKGAAVAVRKVMDGISMLMTQDFDIKGFAEYTRIDVLYGYKTIRPDLATRVTK